MGTVKAYRVCNRDGMRVVLSRGKALDFCKDPVVMTLHYEGDINEAVKSHDTVWFISSSICSYGPDVTDHLYFSRDEAIEAAQKAGAPDVGVWCCHSFFFDGSAEDYQPIDLPVRVMLMRNDRGLYCRLNLHPEEDGWRSRGKVFFPDRTCADRLCEGPVMIQSVKDKGNYGFFTGEMVQYKAPTDEQVSEFVIQNELYQNKVRFMNGKFGSYVHIFGVPGYLDCFVQSADGSIERSCDVSDFGGAVTCLILAELFLSVSKRFLAWIWFARGSRGATLQNFTVGL